MVSDRGSEYLFVSEGEHREGADTVGTPKISLIIPPPCIAWGAIVYKLLIQQAYSADLQRYAWDNIDDYPTV